MARPRTPTNVLELRGAFDKNPNRRRVDPETSGEIGDPPEYFDQAHRDIWQEIVSNAPLKVLTVADRQIVEIATRLIFESRFDWENFSAGKIGRLESMLGKLGMTPADRSKVGGGKKEAHKNPFMDL